MARYIAFLRGINVANRRVTMVRLRSLFEDLELGGVGSYIQTGNVFFDSDQERTALRGRIEAHLGTALGYPVPALLRTVDEVAAALALDPFAGREVTPMMRFAITFTSEPFPVGAELPMITPRGDLEVVAATAGEVFTIWHLVGGRPPSSDLPKGLFTGPVTTRMFSTTGKILAAASR
jgi:uncharacterized protein (DUF1697 family)